jgi:ribulose-5-phosphate 4-epimerase/fuculose-1-phosphate aldolase
MTTVGDMIDVTTQTDTIGPVTDDVAAERLRRQNETVSGYRIFASHGWGDDGSGHISARDPQHTDSFWLLRYGVAFAKATVADLVLVDPDGAATTEGGHQAEINQAAYCIHAPIHRARPDVVSVAHTHTGYGTPFAALARTIRATSQEACAFHDDQAVFEGEELDVLDVRIGDRLAQALGPHKLLILANHGLLTACATVGQAVGFFVLAERAAEVEIKAGNAARVISDASAALVHQSVGHPSQGDSVFQWLRRTRINEG